jgi:threonine dehydrogenase-like Zn-dependent dehydrogenase
VRALAFDGQRPQLIDRPTPEPAEGQVLVRTCLAGICNTDLEIVKGYMGFEGTLGHELVGIVEQGPQRWRGKRIVSEINFACGSCDSCARGLGRHCPTRSVLGILRQDGAFAERVALPVANLHAVPDALSDAQAVFAEPLAAAFEILEQQPVPPGREALVLGDGKLGLLIAQVLDAAGARVTAVGHHDDHLGILRERGIRTCLAADWDRTPRDLVVEATGTVAGFRMAVEATRPRGTLVLKSTVAAREALDLAPLVIHEITVIGSRCGPFAPALDALATGRVHVEPLIAARFDLERGVAALERAGQRDQLKVLLQP